MTERPHSPLAAQESPLSHDGAAGRASAPYAPNPGGSDPETGFDKDLMLNRVVVFVVGLTLLLVAVALVCWAFYSGEHRRLVSLDPRPSPVPEANEPVIPPEPRLQRDPRGDMQSFLAEQNARLKGWGWADEQAATVRMPIDRAIDLMAEKGARAALTESAEGEPPPGGGGK